MKRGRADLRWLLLALAAIAATTPGPAPAEVAAPAAVPAAGGDRQATEAAVKAAFVFKFGEYVEWPPEHFPAADTPLRIGVFANDEVAGELERIVAGRTMAGHPVQVYRLQRGDRVDDLQLLYVGARGEEGDGLLAAAGDGVLTVTDAPGAVPRGSVINFVVVDARVRFDVALRTAEQRHLRISSRLLAVARNVSGRR
ncbi:YfiR family protein [Arenimonas composti]|uniref:YfiR family protein n=1 Tax=Arenimonas composti TaxID=370776 RepID=UPI001376C619|nr:YfiR family protein [Arenimonas composti]